MTASTIGASAVATGRRWPMTREARDRLLDEISQLRRDVEVVAVEPDDPGIIRLPVAHAQRRLETLLDVLDGALVVDGPEPDQAVIGRRVTVRDDGDATDRFALVFPGDGDPGLSWISADAPLGAAILGARPGDIVTVDAPLGRWSATVVAVD